MSVHPQPGLQEDLKWAQSLLAAEKRALEMVSKGAPLAEILQELCRNVDTQAPTALTTILLMDPDGKRLWTVAGPRMPRAWVEQISPLHVGPQAGSCGTAAFLKKRVITQDIATDPLWLNHREAAIRNGIRASWSQPILSKNGDVLGTFAVCFAEPRGPSPSDLQLIEEAGHIALIAIERFRAEEAARTAQVRFEGILAIAQDGIISVDSQQRVILFNQGAEKIFGYSQDEVLHCPLDMLLPERFEGVHRSHIDEFARSPEVARTMGQRREVSGRRKDGSEFPAEASISKLNLDGEVVFTVILRDITERKRAEQRLVAQHTVTQVLAAASTLEEATPRILQAVCDCLAWDLGELWRIDRVADVLRCVEVWHKQSIKAPQFVATSSKMTFNSGIGLPGRVWSNHQPAYIPDVVQDSNFPRASIAALEGLHAAFAFPILLGNEVVGVMDFFSREIRRPDQDLLDMMATIGSQIGQFIERKHAEEALRASMHELKVKQELLDLAQRAARAMPFDWYIQQPVNKWSPEQEALYGLSPGSFDGTYESWKKMIHPDDWPLVVAALKRAHETGDISAEYRVIWPDGSVRWLSANGQMFLDSEHKPFRMVGFTADVTARKLVEEELRRSEAYLAEGQRLSHTGSYAWNVARRELVHWSEEVYRLWGFDPKAGMPTFEAFRERIHPEDRAAAAEALERTMREGVDNEVFFRIVLPDGALKYVHSVGHPVFNAAHGVVEVFGTNMDVTATIEAQQALEKAYNEIQALKDQLQKENIALREELDKSAMFEEIVGSSESLRAVLAQVTKVAPTDSTVLILGETGTGKELIARAIHKRSNRTSRAFIRVNCAAIPQSLIASELFGHEKGAFTGALQRRIGRFESANGGTIFLDEVGELPAETQIALLRVLQEREIERVGSSQSMRVDVRVLAGTNRDLSASVAAGAFRQDLYYRLNVFPINVPPLRDRVEDIPLLVEYLLERYGQKAGKKFSNINRKTLDLFQRYPWPGNVRELQNVIERAVVLCDEATFSVDESWLKSERLQKSTAIPLAASLADREKEIIERALAESGGRIAGPTGAAAKLGLPRQTLESKIKGLGINKYKYKTQQASGD